MINRLTHATIWVLDQDEALAFYRDTLGFEVRTTDDCRGTYAQLKDRGVEFLQEPAERFYGIEAMFRDPFGNWFSLTQRS
jgi:catechol 2,3-dioxygenase-like lactoylglutathione lyase family enzyme